MKRLKALIYVTGLLVAGISMYSCDSLEKDILPQDDDILSFSSLEKTIYIRPAGEGVINLSDKINSTNKVKLTIDQAPANGSLHLLEEGIYKFVAKASFTSGSDKVIFSVLENSSELDRDTVNIVVLQDTVNAPCHSGANPDLYSITADDFIGETFKIDILQNDKLCSNSFEIKQLKDAKEGTSFIKDNYLYYTPSTTNIIKGHDEVVYELCQSVDGEIVCSSAIVTIKHKKMPCIFSVNDDSFQVIYNNMDTLYHLNVLSNDTICGENKNPELAVVDDGGTGATFKDGKLVIPMETDLIFSAVEDFHLIVKYRVCLEGGGCQTAVVKIYVKQNCEFKAVKDHYDLEYLHNSVGDTSRFILKVLENDIVCSDKKTLAISSQPGIGAIAKFVGDVVEFKHDSDRWGEFSFTYLLCDERENCSEAKVTLNITPK